MTYHTTRWSRGDPDKAFSLFQADVNIPLTGSEIVAQDHIAKYISQFVDILAVYFPVIASFIAVIIIQPDFLISVCLVTVPQDQGHSG